MTTKLLSADVHLCASTCTVSTTTGAPRLRIAATWWSVPLRRRGVHEAEVLLNVGARGVGFRCGALPLT